MVVDCNPWNFRLPPVDRVAEVRNEILDLAFGIMERESQVFEALPPDEVGTDAVEHHGRTEALLERLVRFGDPLKGSAKDLADCLNAIVPHLAGGVRCVQQGAACRRSGCRFRVFGVCSFLAP